MARKRRTQRRDFIHHYGGPKALGALLAAAGSPLGVGEVIERMRLAQRERRAASEVIPELFGDGEPRFGDPLEAQLTFQNLLGLWDLLASGRPLPERKVDRPAKPPRPAPVHPGPYGPEGPDGAWVEKAWRYLEDLPERERRRLEDAFENRHDALVGSLDAAGLSDDGYLAVRRLVFELYAMIDLGRPSGRQEPGGARGIPPALGAYADEALFEVEQDQEAPLPAAEAARVRDVVDHALAALWEARRR
jgi:hypothetical protein